MPNPKRQAIVNSALWSAYGDALGFPTELVSKHDFFKRHGKRESAELASWNRRVGGMFGPIVELPSGAYSDDTQLRLSTSRAIQAIDFFDVESFAKIELPIWLNYALGGGRGTKSAAGNLALRETAWSQNFYAKYWEGGGNGAAMRIQPHVWLHPNGDWHNFLGDVLRNSICTHGHPRALIGAAAHAAMLAETIATGRPVPPGSWAPIGERAAQLALEALENDTELPFVWITTWERLAKKPLRRAWKETISEWLEACQVAAGVCESSSDPLSAYVQVLHELNGYDPNERGSGLKSALYASVLAWVARDLPEDTALRIAANEFASDTDTVASMAGALIGVLATSAPQGLQDEAYIRSEAERISDLGAGRRVPSFPYPDLLGWSAPRNQSDAWVVTPKGSQVLSGLGGLTPIGEPYSARKGDIVWQWARLDFGQTVLAKRRAQPATTEAVGTPIVALKTAGNRTTSLQQAPATVPQPSDASPGDQSDLFGSSSPDGGPTESVDLDTLTQQCIKSGFRPELIGEALLRISEGPQAIERAIAFAAVIAKARKARVR